MNVMAAKGKFCYANAALNAFHMTEWANEKAQVPMGCVWVVGGWVGGGGGEDKNSLCFLLCLLHFPFPSFASTGNSRLLFLPSFLPMSRSSENNNHTSTRTRVFPFRSRTASSERTSPSDTSGEQQSKPKKLNSLFHFNKMDDNDYNQARQPYTPGLETNHRQYPNGRTLDVDDDDDHSDNGTVQPGEGRYTLRVINPDPVSDSSSDEEEDQEEEQRQSHNKKEDQQRPQHSMGQSTQSTTTSPPPPTTTHARPPLPSPPSAKLEIAAPTFDSNDRQQSTTAYVTQFLSTASSPTTSSLSLASSSAQHTQVTATATAAASISSRRSSNHGINNITTPATTTHGSSNVTATATTTAAPSLNRRQSKTLHEKPGSVELLPPLDLDPLDWSTFTSNIKASKRLSNIPRVVLGPVSSSTITNNNNEEEASKSIQDDTGATSRPTMFMDQEQLVETPLTLTPRTSQSSMQPRYEPPTPRMQPSLLSPSDSGIISPSLYQGQRSIATTTHESVLVSYTTRSIQMIGLVG